MYLGMPVGADMSKKLSWGPVVEKFRNRLLKWNGCSLSFGGRLTLIKAVLSSLAIYYFSLYMILVGIIDDLESMRKWFFWGGSTERNKIPWIAWNVVLAHKKKGGLRIGSLFAANTSLLVK